MYQGLLQDNGQSYHNWTLAHSTKPVVYVEPISYDDVCAVVSDPTRFPSPVNPVGSMYSVTETIVNNEGTLLCTKKLDEILGLEKLGLTSVVVAPVGFRAETDKYINLVKSRFTQDEVVVKI